MLFSVICPTAFCFAVEKNLKTQSSAVPEPLLCYVWQAAGDVRVTVPFDGQTRSPTAHREGSVHQEQRERKSQER